MSRACFCLTCDKGDIIPTIHINGQELRLSRDEFFRLMSEAAGVAKLLNQDQERTRVEAFYRSNDL